MPKKGYQHPWRVVYLWENGVKGTNTYPDKGAAELFIDAIRKRAEVVDTNVALKLVNRLDDPTPVAKHYQGLAEALCFAWVNT